MLKHDGFPVIINVAGTTCNIFSEIPYQPEKLVESLLLTESGSALLVGARNPRSGEMQLYDTWGADGQSCANLTYRERYVMTKIHVKILKDPRFHLVEVFPISRAPELWLQVVNDPANLKGLVYRRSKDSADGTLFTHRYYPNAPQAFQ